MPDVASQPYHRCRAVVALRKHTLLCVWGQVECSVLHIAHGLSLVAESQGVEECGLAQQVVGADWIAQARDSLTDLPQGYSAGLPLLLG